MYRLAARGVVRIPDQKIITRDIREWEEYRAWLKAGNVPEPQPAPPGPTVAEILGKIKTRITARRDAVMNGVAKLNGTNFRPDYPFVLSLLSMAEYAKTAPGRVFKVKRANGNHINLTADQIGSLAVLHGERVARCMDNEAAHFAAVNAVAAGSGTVREKIEALRAYDFSTGWPE